MKTRSKSQRRRKRRRRRSGNGTSAKQTLYIAPLLIPEWAVIVSTLLLLLFLYITTKEDRNALTGLYFASSWLLLAFPICKIGITGNLKQRKKDIDDSTPGFIIPLAFDIYYAYQIEQYLHRKLKFLSVRWMGTGKTEYFFSIAMIVAIPVALLMQTLQTLIELTICTAIAFVLYFIYQSM